MANTAAPYGFKFVRNVDQRTQNASQATRQIAYNYGTPIYFGDPVVSLNTGYIARAAAGVTQIAGIFYGCKYFNAAVNATVWSKYWPGVAIASTLTVEAFICNDPQAVFQVQAGGTAVTIADIDANIQFNLGTGNATTGISGAYVETPGATATLPFKVVGLVTSPPGINGTDPTTAYNDVLVSFNYQDFRSLDGI